MEDRLAGERQFLSPKCRGGSAAATCVEDEDASDLVGTGCEAVRRDACFSSRCLILGCACDDDRAGRWALAGKRHVILPVQLSRQCRSLYCPPYQDNKPVHKQMCSP